MADIKAIITNAANRYGVDPDTAIRIASIESRLNPQARNSKSGASGLFQFIPSTWGSYGNGRSPFDPEANADAGMRFIRDNINTLRRGLGRDPTPGEIYMAHQQGAGGALSILKDPTAPAYTKVGRKAVGWNLPTDRQGEAMTITAGDFAALWSSKMGDASVASKLYTGGAVTGSVNTESTFRAHDGIDPTKTRITLDETDSSRFKDSITERLELEKKEKEREEEAPGFFEGAALAIGNEWSVLAPFRAIGNFTPDPDYRIDEAEIKRLGEGVPTQYLTEFEDAVSPEHANAIRDRIIRQLEVNQKLSSMGATGVGLQVAAAMTDPGAWAATAAISAATGGFGAPAAVAARFGRIGTVALGALEGAAGNLAVDGALYAVDPTKTKSDLMYSIGTGIVMGGALAGWRNPSRVLAQENEMMENVGHAMTAEARGIVNAGKSVGAAQSNFVEPMLRQDARTDRRAFEALDKMYEVAFGGARFDLAAQFGKSKNVATRVLGKYFVEDAVGNKLKDKVSVIAASEVQRDLARVANYSWMKTFDENWQAYRKANKIGILKAAEEQQKFSKQITAWQRADGEAKKLFPKEVQAAGAKFDQIMKDWWKKAQDEGITRSELGAENYVPRITNRDAAVGYINKYGYQKNMNGEYTGVTKHFIEAIKKEQPNVKPELAEKMGYAIVDRMYRMGNGEELGLSRALTGEDLDDFRKLLLDARFDGGNMMSEVEVDEIINNLKGTRSAVDKEAGGSSRLKHRVLLDENFSMDYWDASGTTKQTLKISDFYLDDANVLMSLYNRNMSGQIALSRIRIADPLDDTKMLIDGIRSPSDMETLIKRITAVNAEQVKAGVKGLNLEEDIKNLRYAYDAVAGIPRFDETGDLNRFMRVLRDFNFTRLMGQVGFSQIPEGIRAVAQMGPKAAYMALPEYRRMISMARSGKHVDGLMDEIDELVAPGADFQIGAVHIPTESFGVPQAINGTSSSRLGKAMDWIDPKLHAANRAVAMGSLMAPINTTLQRVAARSFAQKFGIMAKGGKRLSIQRMRLMGLDDDKIDAVLGAINKHSTFDGQRITKLNVGEWPVQAREAYTEAMSRAVRNMILENDVGQFAKWMQSPVGKVALQFRSFAVGAWTRGLMQGLNQRDLAAGLQFMFASVIGSLVYYGQTHLQLLGDPDRDRKIKERLSWGNLGMAGVMRSSESSLLPMLIDTGASFTVGEPVLDYRSSGLTGLLFGNPSADLFNKAAQASSGIITGIAGDDYSRPDAKALTDILPFQRLMPIQWFLNWATSSLPRRELRD